MIESETIKSVNICGRIAKSQMKETSLEVMFKSSK